MDEAEVSDDGLAGEDFADYELLEKIERGGMGVVWRARQISLNRVVALKMIETRARFDPKMLARFRAETDAVADLEHPNIIPIYEVGDWQGQAYFSMKYVAGGSLEERVSQSAEAAKQSAFGSGSRSAWRSRYEDTIRLLVKVCRAVHYAHGRGVLHRDLKPSNILLDESGEPFVADFGLAKRLGSDSEVTRAGAVIGTPAFMAPEQASGCTEEIATTADVYSLGGLLYYSLLGEAPFTGTDVAEILRRVIDSEPISPSVRDRKIDPDLATIALKCLEKSPSGRYATAAELADDLERWLHHEPVLARPASSWDQLHKWARRRPAVAALTLVCVLSFLAFGAQLWFSRQALEIERNRAVENEQAARKLAAAEKLARLRAEKLEAKISGDLRQVYLDRAEARLAVNDSGAGIAYLTAILREIPTNRPVLRRLLQVLEQRNFPAQSRVTRRLHTEVTCARFDPSGEQVITGNERGEVGVWSVPAGKEQHRFSTGEAPVRVAEISADGEHILVAAGGSLSLWRSDGTQVGESIPHESSILSAGFSADSQWVATASEHHIGRLFELNADGLRLVKETARKRDFCFHPSRARIVWTSRNGGVELMDLPTGRRVFRSSHGPGDIQAVFGRGGRFVASYQATGPSPKVHLWGAEQGRSMRMISHGAPIVHAAFGPMNRYVALSSEDHTVKICNFRTGVVRHTLAHPARVVGAVYSRNNIFLATLTATGELRLWWRTDRRVALEPQQHRGGMRSLQFSRDSRWLLSIDENRRARLQSLPAPQEEDWNDAYGVEVTHLRFLDQGKIMAVIFRSGAIRFVELEEDEKHGFTLHQRGVAAMDSGSNGEFLLSAGKDGDVRFTTAPGGDARVKVLPVQTSENWVSVDIRTGDEQALLLEASGRGRIIDLTESVGRELCSFEHGGPVLGGRFIDGGRRLATWGTRSVKIWDSESGELQAPVLEAKEDLRVVTFDPTGRQMAFSTRGDQVTIHPLEGDRPAVVLPHEDEVLALAFSSDGRLLATGSRDQKARIWDTKSGKLRARPMPHGAAVNLLRLTSDNQLLLTGCADGAVRIWDAASGVLVTEPGWHAGRVSCLAIDESTGRVASGSTGGNVRQALLPAPAPTAAPFWLLDLAEALGGTVLSEDGLRELSSEERVVSKEWIPLARGAGGPLSALAERFAGDQ